MAGAFVVGVPDRARRRKAPLARAPRSSPLEVLGRQASLLKAAEELERSRYPDLRSATAVPVARP